MEISTFEILTAPIAPVVGIPPALIPVARRVVQGYFLTISNLEAISVQYRIEFKISLPVPANPNKILLNNAVLIVDVEGANTTIPLTQQPARPEVYQGFFTIPAHKTASVELLPKLPDVLTPGLLEVRGYVSLFPLHGRVIRPPFLRQVKVLLNPEIRGTFLPNGFPSVPNTALDFDQINYTLAIASGKALNEITVEPGRPIIIDPPILDPILEQFRNGTLDLPSLGADNSEKALMLVQLLAELDASQTNLNDLNTVMEKLEIPVRMSSI
ncbi:hypothetical protein QUB56_36090 [Microcoleus sp. AR_TQ3_B6]|uniref:hypothetical protein n=1 Tax=Microcoleus sp. AR_TQ3_B6 TaxID=3055284 RepID=UPI002FD04B15